MNALPSPFSILLPKRGLIRVGGEDAGKFLQGLISNDIRKLETQASLYACLLTPQGKFLHDFFITREEDTYLLDCEGEDRAQDLLRRLTMYKLRAKVTFECTDSIDVYANSYSGIADPRHPGLGLRSFLRPALPLMPFTFWDEQRIRLGLIDGSRDAELEISTLEELNIADTAVSFDKGCYVGQELTTRMEMRGLGKKHLLPLGFNGQVPFFSDPLKNADGKVIAEMRSSCGTVGLALVRDDALEELRTYDEQSPFYLLG
jgi:hypothetical protein